MTSLKELISYLDTYLEVGTFNDYCPNGLQVEGKPKVTKIATAVSASASTIEKAIDKNVDALIVHHGLFWKGDSYPIINEKREKLRLLLENNISLLAYHLPLDAHREVGNNWVAARELKWSNLEPFGGIGVKGEFEPLSFEKFVKQVERYYDHKATYAPFGKKKVGSCALISGRAYKELSKAADCGVDAFITGNFDEPAWWVAQERGIHFLALGHTATETIGPKKLAQHLREHFKTFFLDNENLF